MKSDGRIYSMDIDYRLIRKDDAGMFLDYMKTIAGETDNLVYSVSDIENLDEVDEKIFISELRNSRSFTVVAVADGMIAGSCDIRVGRRLRIRHRGEFAVSVRKAFWGRGIGKHLTEFAIAEAEERGIAILSTSVRNDNERAIDFLLRNGFEDAGPDPMLYSIDGEFIDGKRYFRKI